jgi:hypothetical protein
MRYDDSVSSWPLWEGTPTALSGALRLEQFEVFRYVGVIQQRNSLLPQGEGLHGLLTCVVKLYMLESILTRLTCVIKLHVPENILTRLTCIKLYVLESTCIHSA